MHSKSLQNINSTKAKTKNNLIRNKMAYSVIKTASQSAAYKTLVVTKTHGTFIEILKDLHKEKWMSPKRQYKLSINSH